MKIVRVLAYFIGAVILACFAVFGIAQGNHALSAALLLVLLAQVGVLVYSEINFYRPIGALLAIRGEEDEKKMAADLQLAVRGLDDPFLKETVAAVSDYIALTVRRNSAEIFNKQTELAALQSQINPHFLYNTLDTIRGQAMLNDDAEVAKMIETLASFFRYSISRKGNLVTLRDELNNVRNYMSIQQYRFANRFTMETEIDEADEAAYDYYVPRLILQPLIENAVVHGLEDVTSGGLVTISVVVADDMILTVSDNGKGIALSELDALNDRIHSGDNRMEQESMQEKAGAGIALSNVNKRIRLLFGPKYGLNLYSSAGQGTDVEIVLPIINRKEELQVE